MEGTTNAQTVLSKTTFNKLQNIGVHSVCTSIYQTNVSQFFELLFATFIFFFSFCVCVIIRFPLYPTGSGTSKKLAKRNAAAKMLSRIHDVPVDLRTNNEADPEDDNFHMVKKIYIYI